MSVKMKLGWWRDREGKEHKVEGYRCGDPYPYASADEVWSDDGSYTGNSAITHRRDLMAFLRPLEDLPPALNSAAKAAEDRVRELRQMVDETQTAWATACRLHEAAQRELVRMEKECEVGK